MLKIKSRYRMLNANPNTASHFTLTVVDKNYPLVQKSDIIVDCIIS